MTPAPDVNVLVVFYSRHGKAETLALRAGVGALQGRANIRLRRLDDSASEETIAADALWTETRLRLHRDYVVPRPADPVWANIIVLSAPADALGEAEAYLALLAAGDSMTGRILAPLVAGTRDGAFERLSAAGAAAGFTVASPLDTAGDPIAAAEIHGRRITQLFRDRSRT